VARRSRSGWGENFGERYAGRQHAAKIGRSSGRRKPPMVDMAAVVGFTQSVRAAVEITKAMKDLHDANLIQTKTFELTREILSAQGYAMEAAAAQSALLERVASLKQKKPSLNHEMQRSRGTS
jgi:hypothetical protein